LATNALAPMPTTGRTCEPTSPFNFNASAQWC
jgi:hypothetical protein